jgi:hypothetical protein
MTVSAIGNARVCWVAACVSTRRWVAGLSFERERENMGQSRRAAHAMCAAILFAVAPATHASEAPFLSGRFMSDSHEIFSGVFNDDVVIDTLTLGSATYRASMDELIEPLTVRISIDSNDDGIFGLLTDEMLRSGKYPAGFALALNMDPADYATALDAMQGLSLAHMIYTDGTTAVQIDVLLIVSLYDDRPAEDDATPELVMIGSMNGHDIAAAAIIGGNVDEPIFAREPLAVSAESFDAGVTGVEMVIRQMARPNEMTIVGLDLSHDLGVEEGVQAIGYRVTIGPGKPAMINVLGAGLESQRTLAQDMPIVPDVEEFLLGALLSSPSGGGGSVFRVPGVQESVLFNPRVPIDFRGGGDGGGSGAAAAPIDPEEPVIPAPATLAAIAVALALNRRRRRA